MNDEEAQEQQPSPQGSSDHEQPSPSRSDDRQQPGEQGEPGGRQQPSEEELRRRVEEQLRKVRVQDLLLESVVSIINLAARRIAKEDERDLEQARVGIEAVRALVGLLDPEPAQQVRGALSEVQLLYANAAGGTEPEGGPAEPSPGGQPGAPSGQPPRQGQGPPSKLWTPPGT
jgi:hypothetical protein